MVGLTSLNMLEQHEQPTPPSPHPLPPCTPETTVVSFGPPEQLQSSMTLKRGSNYAASLRRAHEPFSHSASVRMLDNTICVSKLSARMYVSRFKIPRLVFTPGWKRLTTLPPNPEP